MIRAKIVQKYQEDLIKKKTAAMGELAIRGTRNKGRTKGRGREEKV